MEQIIYCNNPMHIWSSSPQKLPKCDRKLYWNS